MLDLDIILAKHTAWLRGEPAGQRADLCGADLRGANLRRADLSERIPLHVDTARRYILYVIPEARGGPRFVAGCRNFSATEALAHWGPESSRSQPQYVAAIRRWLTDNDHALAGGDDADHGAGTGTRP